MLKKILAAIGTVAVLVFATAFMIGYLEQPAPQAVPHQQISALVTCIVNDTCKVPRTKVRLADHEMWSVGIRDGESTVQYLVGGDLVLNVVVVVDGRQSLIADKGSGKVESFSYVRGDKVVTYVPGDHWFEAKFPDLQQLYLQAMYVAAEMVIPTSLPDRST